MSKSSFLAALYREQDNRNMRLHRADQIVHPHSHEREVFKPASSSAGPSKAGMTVDQDEVEPQSELDLANCSLFTAFGVNAELTAWFKQNCASSAHLSTKHEICLEEDEDEGSSCVICQDTTAGCFLYITLPCCQQVVGDECLLTWFMGGEISNANGTGSRKLASTTCPCCRADLLPKPVESHVSWEDEQDETALAEIIEESRAWITNRPPPPQEGGLPKVRREGKRKHRGILEALHLRRRASIRHSSPTMGLGVLEGFDVDGRGLVG